jgi:hypothetical protein
LVDLRRRRDAFPAVDRARQETHLDARVKLLKVCCACVRVCGVGGDLATQVRKMTLVGVIGRARTSTSTSSSSSASMTWTPATATGSGREMPTDAESILLAQAELAMIDAEVRT